MASVSPKHDTHPLMVAVGRVLRVSLLAADQIGDGQYFSYPGRKLPLRRRRVPDRLVRRPGRAAGRARTAIAWLRCETFEVEADGRPRAVLRPGRRGRSRIGSRSRRCSTRAGSAGGSPATRPASRA